MAFIYNLALTPDKGLKEGFVLDMTDSMAVVVSYSSVLPMGALTHLRLKH